MKYRGWLQWLMLLLAFPLGAGFFWVMGGPHMSGGERSVLLIVAVALVLAILNMVCQAVYRWELQHTAGHHNAESQYRIVYSSVRREDDLWVNRPGHGGEDRV